MQVWFATLSFYDKNIRSVQMMAARENGLDAFSLALSSTFVSKELCPILCISMIERRQKYYDLRFANDFDALAET